MGLQITGTAATESWGQSSVIVGLEQQRFVRPIQDQRKCKRDYRTSCQITQGDIGDGVAVVHGIAEQFNPMENWIPGNKRTGIGGNFKRCKENTRRKDNNPLDNTLNYADECFIQLAQKNKI